MRQVAETRTAVFLGNGHAEQAHIAELPPHVAGEQIVAVDGGGTRRQLGSGERLYLLAQHIDGFTEGEIEAGVSHGATCLVVVLLDRVRRKVRRSSCDWRISCQSVTFTLAVNLPLDDCQHWRRPREVEVP